MNAQLEAMSHEGLEQAAAALQSYARHLQKQGRRPARDFVLLAADLAARAMSGQDGLGLAELLTCQQPSVVPIAPLRVDLDTAGTVLGLSLSGVKRLVRSGALPSVKVGGRRLVRTAELHTYDSNIEDSA